MERELEMQQLLHHPHLRPNRMLLSQLEELVGNGSLRHAQTRPPPHQLHQQRQGHTNTTTLIMVLCSMRQQEHQHQQPHLHLRPLESFVAVKLRDLSQQEEEEHGLQELEHLHGQNNNNSSSNNNSSVL